MAENSIWLEDEAAGQIASVVMKKEMTNFPLSYLSPTFVLQKLFILFSFMCSMCICTHVCSAHGDQKGESDPLELVTFVSH